MLRPFFAIMLLIPAATSHAAAHKVACLGAPSAPRKIIYLRGITPASPSINPPRLLHDIAIEKADYATRLLVLAQSEKSQFAVIESDDDCRLSWAAHCWLGDTPEAIAFTYEGIVDAAAECFPTRKDYSFELFGFSNGGYQAARVVMQCLTPRPKKVWAFGSAGDIHLASRSNLSACTQHLSLAVGDLDVTRLRTKLFADQLKNRRLSVSYDEFFSGHDWNANTVKWLFKKYP